jgi:hypothetical protein
MKNVKAWKTTLIGLVLIGGGLASVYMGKADWTGAMVVIGLGVGLIFSPDTVIDKITKKDA